MIFQNLVNFQNATIQFDTQNRFTLGDSDEVETFDAFREN